jgi:hypothetical protein
MNFVLSTYDALLYSDVGSMQQQWNNNTSRKFADPVLREWDSGCRRGECAIEVFTFLLMVPLFRGTPLTEPVTWPGGWGVAERQNTMT